MDPSALLLELIQELLKDPQTIRRLSSASPQLMSKISLIQTNNDASASVPPASAPSSSTIAFIEPPQSPLSPLSEDDSSSDMETDFQIIRNKRVRSPRPTRSRSRSPLPISSPAKKAAKKVVPDNPAPVREPTSVPETATSIVSPPSVSKEPPPVIIYDKERWTEISAACASRKINYLRATANPTGIRVSVPTPGDHRAFTKLLDERKVSFHTYTLEEERKLRVVIKNVPKEIPVGEIEADLKRQNLPVEKVHRISSPSRGKVFDLVFVTLEFSEEGRKVYGLKTLCNLSGIIVQEPKKSAYPGQCHNCQRYGHSSRNCHATPRCVKCLGDHGTAQCERPKRADLSSLVPEAPPACVNCGKTGHTANFRGCERAPPPRKLAVPPVQATKQGRPPKSRSAPQATNVPPPTAPSEPISAVKLQPAWVKPLAWVAKPKTANPPQTPQTSQSAPPASSNKAKPKPAAATAAPAARRTPPQGNGEVAEAMKVVSSFTSLFSFADILRYADVIRCNIGNPDALLQATLEFAPLVQAMGSFTLPN